MPPIRTGQGIPGNIRNLSSSANVRSGMEFKTFRNRYADPHDWPADLVLSTIIRDEDDAEMVYISSHADVKRRNLNHRKRQYEEMIVIDPDKNTGLRFWYAIGPHPGAFYAWITLGTVIDRLPNLYFETAKDLYIFLKCLEGVQEWRGEDTDTREQTIDDLLAPGDRSGQEFTEIENTLSLLDLVEHVNVADISSGPFVKEAVRMLQKCQNLESFQFGVCYNCNESRAPSDLLSYWGRIRTKPAAGNGFQSGIPTVRALRRWKPCSFCNRERTPPTYNATHDLAAAVKGEDDRWTNTFRQGIQPMDPAETADGPLIEHHEDTPEPTWLAYRAAPPTGARTRRQRAAGRTLIHPYQLSNVEDVPLIRTLIDALT